MAGAAGFEPANAGTMRSVATLNITDSRRKLRMFAAQFAADSEARKIDAQIRAESGCIDHPVVAEQPSTRSCCSLVPYAANRRFRGRL